MSNDRRLGWALAATGFLLISTDSIFVRLSGASDWDIAFIVSVFALPVYLILNRFFDKVGPLESFRAYPGPLLLVALMAAVSQVTFIATVNRTEIANVVVVIGSAPIWAALAAWLILGERADRRTWLAIGAVMTGILIVVSGSLGQPSLSGDLWALVAITVFSVNFTIWRRYPEMSRFVGLGISAIMIMVVAAPFSSPLGHDASVYLPLLAMGLVFNPIGRSFHTTAPKYAPAAEAALFVPLETMSATLLAWLAFSETPDTRTVIGGILVIGAVLWGTFGRLVGQTKRESVT